MSYNSFMIHSFQCLFFKFPENSQRLQSLKKKEVNLTYQMHKNISFKIHRQKLTLANQPKTIKQNQKIIGLQIQRCESRKKNSCVSGNETTAKSLKKSKSMLLKRDEKQNVIFKARIPSIRVLNIENIAQQSQDPFGGICFIAPYSPVKSLLTTLLQSLLKKQLKFQPLKSSFLIQKTYFVNLLEYFFSLPHAKNRTQCHRHFQEYALCWPVFQQLVCMWECYFIGEKKIKLDINSGIISQKNYHRPKQSNMHLGSSSEYNTLKRTKDEIEILQRQKLGLQAEKEKLISDINQKSTHLTIIDNDVRLLEIKSLVLNQEISSLEDRVKKARTDAADIFNYVNNQRNGVLKMVSAQYKQIEADLYDYAAYLQANVLASELEYQPHPYQEIQTLMKQQFTQISSVQQYLTEQDKDSKLSKLVAFGQKVLSFMGKKDSQMGKLLEFKTKCIRTFVKNMKKWLDNWSLKQQYLNNLRVNFAAEANLFRQIYRSIECELIGGKANQLSSLLECFLCIQENYKLGNSFY